MLIFVDVWISMHGFDMDSRTRGALQVGSCEKRIIRKSRVYEFYKRYQQGYDIIRSYGYCRGL